MGAGIPEDFLRNVVEDDSPRLGGNLDCNGYPIVSINNLDIAITPHGTGAVVLKGLSWPVADGSLGDITIPNKRVVLGPAAEQQDCTRVVMGAAEGQDCERVVLAPAEEKEDCNRVVVGPCRSTEVVGVVRNGDGTIRITRQ